MNVQCRTFAIGLVPLTLFFRLYKLTQYALYLPLMLSILLQQVHCHFLPSVSSLPTNFYSEYYFYIFFLLIFSLMLSHSNYKANFLPLTPGSYLREHSLPTMTLAAEINQMLLTLYLEQSTKNILFIILQNHNVLRFSGRYAAIQHIPR